MSRYIKLYTSGLVIVVRLMSLCRLTVQTFIVSFALYFCIIALLKYDIWTFDVGNVSSYLGPVTGFIMFFSVFYNNQ